VFRTFDEAGETAFVDAIRRVSVSSLDRLDVLQRNDLGAEKYAQEFYRVLKEEFEFYPHWWLLAYTPSGELVGHVVNVPYNLHHHEGTVGYVGVVPEQRGHGYITDILTQGMYVMTRDGIRSIICDTDQLNAPMIAAFERLGYLHTGIVWVYHAELSQRTRSR
jgi:RimJ/RimL family protein N-acetyltransferase